MSVAVELRRVPQRTVQRCVCASCLSFFPLTYPDVIEDAMLYDIYMPARHMDGPDGLAIR